MAKRDSLMMTLGRNVQESTAIREIVTEPVLFDPNVKGPHSGTKKLDGGKLVPLSRIIPDPDQPRKIFTEAALQELADSILAHGLLQPIRLRFDAELDQYVIIAGERRWRAARLAGLTDISAVVAGKELTPTAIAIEQLVENCMREDLSELERAQAYKRILDLTGWSSRRLGEELKMSHQTINRALKLLELPEDVQQLVQSGELAASTASEIARVPESQRRAVAEQVIKDKLVPHQAAKLANDRGAKSHAPRKPKQEHVVILKDGGKVICRDVRVGEGRDGILAVLHDALMAMADAG
jgi:ParB family chromosome partitioning protein